MATTNYLYRSKKKEAFLTLRLLYRLNKKDYSLDCLTKIEVSSEYWQKHHNNKRLKDVDIINKRNEVNIHMADLSKHILSSFNVIRDFDYINKEWLKKEVRCFYNPKSNASLPDKLIDYIDYYLLLKNNDLKASSITKCNVTKKMFLNYQNSSKKSIYIDEFDLSFKSGFEIFAQEKGYSPNTIARAIKFGKTICLHARKNGLKTHFQLDSITAKYLKVSSVYLNENDLKKIEELKEENIHDYLSNAKDWLIISCYTGQRVSDFMRFNKNMLREENGKLLIEFTQQKTGKIMVLPIHEKVLSILKKRNNEFPRKISDQRYNEYIKEVCRIAGIDEIISSGKINPKTNRKESGEFEKWELVSSHIGRRSFATNYYGKIPTPLLMSATGHSTEAMFLTYIGKSATDQAIQLAEYF